MCFYVCLDGTYIDIYANMYTFNMYKLIYKCINREELAYSNIDVLESKTIKEPHDSTDCKG